MTPDDFTTQPESWPALPLEAWQDTYATLHMWTQIVGKVRLAQSPLVNHWWEVPLYISARGLTTSAIPYQRGIFEVEFDFLRHNLVIQTSEGRDKNIPLAPRSVADFYKEFMAALAGLGIDVKIWHMPVEIPNPIAFDLDTQHACYDREYVTREKKSLVATAKGAALIKMLPSPLLKSAELTGRWEQKLSRMARREYELDAFMVEVRAMVSELVAQIAGSEVERPAQGSASSRQIPRPEGALDCPKCKKEERAGFLIEREGANGKFLACSLGRGGER